MRRVLAIVVSFAALALGGCFFSHENGQQVISVADAALPLGTGGTLHGGEPASELHADFSAPDYAGVISASELDIFTRVAFVPDPAQTAAYRVDAAAKCLSFTDPENPDQVMSFRFMAMGNGYFLGSAAELPVCDSGPQEYSFYRITEGYIAPLDADDFAMKFGDWAKGLDDAARGKLGATVKANGEDTLVAVAKPDAYVAYFHSQYAAPQGGEPPLVMYGDPTPLQIQAAGKAEELDARLDALDAP